MTVCVYRKTAVVLAEVQTEPGSVVTPEGVMSYGAGDYLVVDEPPTHIWPVKREVFERTHQRVIEAENRAAFDRLREQFSE